MLRLYCVYSIIDGSGTAIKLEAVGSIEFISTHQLILSDHDNYCILELDMNSLTFSVFAGECGGNSGHQDGHRLTEAKLVNPGDLQRLDSVVYLLSEMLLKIIDLTTDILTTTTTFEYDPVKFVLDSNSMLVYLIHPANQIDILNLENNTIQKLVGTTSDESGLLSTGTFNETRFDAPKDMAFLADNLLLVCNYKGDR